MPRQCLERKSTMSVRKAHCGNSNTTCYILTKKQEISNH